MEISAQAQSCDSAVMGLQHCGQRVDIGLLSIDRTLDKTDRIQLYLEAVKDPYRFRVGDTPVNVSYGDGAALQESITKLLSGKNTGSPGGFML